MLSIYYIFFTKKNKDFIGNLTYDIGSGHRMSMTDVGYLKYQPQKRIRFYALHAGTFTMVV